MKLSRDGRATFPCWSLNQCSIERDSLRPNIQREGYLWDPHFREREMLVEPHHHALGLVVVPGIVPKLSRGAGRLYRLARKSAWIP